MYLHNVYIYIYIQCHFLFYIYNRFFYVTYKQPSPNFQVQKWSQQLSDTYQNTYLTPNNGNNEGSTVDVAIFFN